MKLKVGDYLNWAEPRGEASDLAAWDKLQGATNEG
jgi:hypothetical protein